MNSVTASSGAGCRNRAAGAITAASTYHALSYCVATWQIGHATRRTPQSWFSVSSGKIEFYVDPFE
jgi:hypothetical protein